MEVNRARAMKDGGVINERDTTREIFDTVSDIDLIRRTPEFAGTHFFYLLLIVHSIIQSFTHVFSYRSS